MFISVNKFNWDERISVVRGMKFLSIEWKKKNQAT